MFEFYKGKRVFLTGITGFKGSWLALMLKGAGADVLGYALEPNTEPSMFKVLEIPVKTVIGNILDVQKLEKAVNDFQPEIIFHLAAQPLVRQSYNEPVLTYQTNVIGTLNLLEAARKCTSVKAFVNVTTDKCYENKEMSYAYKEDDPMGGYDMYSSSKACAEILCASYRNSFLQEAKPFALATVRAGNVIGGGDWAQDRLIPDCIRAIHNQKPIEIRNPHAIRPWQHVLEPLSGYLILGELLFTDGEKYAQGFNFGPEKQDALTVEEIVKKVIANYGTGEVIVGKKDDLHEAQLLMLDNSKAKKMLGWQPLYSPDEAINATTQWYKSFYEGQNMLEFTYAQAQKYEGALCLKN